jgi:hypothetical protein
MPRNPRLVLKPDTSDEDVSRLAGREDWLLSAVNPGDEDQAFEKIWEADGGSVHFLINPVTEVRYLTTRGDRAGELLETIRSGLPVYSLDELHHDVDHTQDKWERVEAVHRLGFGAPVTADEKTLQRFDAAFGDAEPELRLAAALASYYAGWPELKARLERLTEDPEDDVRESAEEILDDLETLLAS